MPIKDIATVIGDHGHAALLQTGVRDGRLTIDVQDGDTAKIHLDDTEAIALAAAIIQAVTDQMRARRHDALAADS